MSTDDMLHSVSQTKKDIALKEQVIDHLQVENALLKMKYHTLRRGLAQVNKVRELMEGASEAEVVALAEETAFNGTDPYRRNILKAEKTLRKIRKASRETIGDMKFKEEVLAIFEEAS